MRKLWIWLTNSDNRGALDFILKYLFGPFSILGVIYLLFIFFFEEPVFSFEVWASGGGTPHSNEELISLSIANKGAKIFFAPEGFECRGERVEKFNAQVHLDMRTSLEERGVEPEEVKKIVYFVNNRSVYLSAAEDEIGIRGDDYTNRKINDLFNVKNLQVFKCRVGIITSRETKIGEFWFHTKLEENGLLRFTPDSDHLKFIFPE